jgi:hypothetical protein
VVCTENDPIPVTQLHPKLRRTGFLEFTRSTCYQILDARGGAKVRQSMLEFPSYSLRKIALCFGLVLAELTERLRGKGEFQHGPRYPIPVWNPRGPV